MSTCVGSNSACRRSITAGSWLGPFQRTHGSFSELECVAYKVLDDSKVTKHFTDGCCCKYISAPVNELEKVVRKGFIPLVQVHRRTDAHLSVSIVEHEPGQNFIAVSHVWSHGLGNGVSNSLPSCQIKRVVNLVAGPSKQQPLLFWLDTFCVLPRTFRTPLFRHQRNQDNLRSSPQSLGVRAKNSWHQNSPSKYMKRRLWTLHEAVRSSQIYSQFTYGFVGHEDLVARWLQDKMGTQPK